MKEKLNNNKIYAIYTALFILIVCIVFGIFFVNNRTFIWQADGLRQHYIILKDFNEIIRNFLASPQEGMKLFSWNMGLGFDIIGQYSFVIPNGKFRNCIQFFSITKTILHRNFFYCICKV